MPRPVLKVDSERQTQLQLVLSLWRASPTRVWSGGLRPYTPASTLSWQVMGLQHAMAMLAGLTTVPYLIGVNAFNVRGWLACAS